MKMGNLPSPPWGRGWPATALSSAVVGRVRGSPFSWQRGISPRFFPLYAGARARFLSRDCGIGTTAKLGHHQPHNCLCFPASMRHAVRKEYRFGRKEPRTAKAAIPATRSLYYSPKSSRAAQVSWHRRPARGTARMAVPRWVAAPLRYVICVLRFNLLNPESCFSPPATCGLPPTSVEFTATFHESP
jgi:hypothetical protein